jgi:Asp-tRNA(Asn)/Glu-tRNA(Gln) amidotransferase A subunit family amidase
MNIHEPRSRRDALAALAALAGLPVVLPRASAATPASPHPPTRLAASDPDAVAITARTIAEAEKLHDLSFTPAQRQQLVTTIPNDLAGIRAIRQVSKERSLMPALHFDPRLPGKSYGPQADRLRLVGKVHEKMPTDPVAIAYASVRDQGHWLRTRQISSRRLTDIYLERIERIAPTLQCFITVTAELARSQADEADRELAAGRDRGALHGIPYGIKDVFDTAGVRSTWGAAAFKDRIAREDAAVVSRLRGAGSVLLGKLATGNLAFGSAWFGGDTRNPWNLAESAGGSSTGSGSATAAGLVAYSLGTDSLGSILNPADRCGVTGLRPTFGRVSTRNSMPLTPSLTRIGPITRSVEDAALVLAALNGHDPELVDSLPMGFAYDGSIDLSRLKVGYSPRWFESIGLDASAPSSTSPAQRSVPDALRELGVQLTEIELPHLPVTALIPLLFVEAAAVFEDFTLEQRDDQLVAGEAGLGWPHVWRQARLYSAVDYVQADRVRRLVMIEYDRLFERIDVLCGPLYGESIELVAATNFTGHPGLTFRVGFSETPTRTILGAIADPAAARVRVTQNIAMHGRLFEEGAILGLARALEEKLGVWQERPPVG